MPKGLLTMSVEELNRSAVITQVAEKRLKQGVAAKQLGITIRQVKRLLKKYRDEGVGGLLSKQRGQKGHHRYSDDKKEKIKVLVEQYYRDFGPKFASEKLKETHQMAVNKETLRQWMTEWSFWNPKRHKAVKIHPQRERRESFGELIQIDGSPHAWFEERGDKCCLLAFIDDATSQILGLRFEPTETTAGYFQLLRACVEQYGIPLALYSDKHGIFRVNLGSAQDAETQFGRVARELGIELICANSPQAKGRVERLNSTLQDRLVKELRLAGINNIEDGNVFLPGYCKEHNRRFAVEPKSTVDVHRKEIPEKGILDLLFSFQEDRKISKNLEVSYRNMIYQIKTETRGYRLQQGTIKVCEDLTGVISLLYHGKKLDYTVINKSEKRRPEIVDAKQLSSKLETVKRTIPKANHPWRHYVINPAKQAPHKAPHPASCGDNLS